MDVDRRTVVELAVSTFIIGVFTAGAYVVSQAYASPRNGTVNSSIPPAIEPVGGLALVGTLVLFILVVAASGLFIYSQNFDDE